MGMYLFNNQNTHIYHVYIIYLYFKYCVNVYLSLRKGNRMIPKHY